MDPEIENILLDNLKETLKQFQNYLVWGIIASVSYFILISSKSSTANINLPVIGSFGNVDIRFAELISLAVFWLVGAMAGYALERAERISLKFHNDPGKLKAVATYPSIATEIYPVRIFAGLLSVVIMVFARIENWNKNYAAGSQVIKLVFLIIPYITIIILLLKNSLPIDKPEKLKIEV